MICTLFQRNGLQKNVLLCYCYETWPFSLPLLKMWREVCQARKCWSTSRCCHPSLPMPCTCNRFTGASTVLPAWSDSLLSPASSFSPLPPPLFIGSLTSAFCVCFFLFFSFLPPLLPFFLFVFLVPLFPSFHCCCWRTQYCSMFCAVVLSLFFCLLCCCSIFCAVVLSLLFYVLCCCSVTVVLSSVLLFCHLYSCSIFCAVVLSSVLLFYLLCCCSVISIVVLSSALLFCHQHCCSIFCTVALSSALLFNFLHCCSVISIVVLSSVLLFCHQHCCSVFCAGVLSSALLFCLLRCCSNPCTVDRRPEGRRWTSQRCRWQRSCAASCSLSAMRTRPASMTSRPLRTPSRAATWTWRHCTRQRMWGCTRGATPSPASWRWVGFSWQGPWGRWRKSWSTNATSWLCRYGFVAGWFLLYLSLLWTINA